MARNLPFGLSETLVTALMRSREDHPRELPLSAQSLEGEPLCRPLACAFDFIGVDRALESGVLGGVD